MSVDLDNPTPETAQHTRIIEAISKERNDLLAQLKALRAKLTTRGLAALLYEELDRDKWGDVDPFWIAMVADGKHEETGEDAEDDDHHEQAVALGKVFDRVAARLKEEG